MTARDDAGGVCAGAEPVVLPARTRERLNETLTRFVAWLDRFGETSYDPHDFWASAAGRRAKALYYRHHALGAGAAAPFVLLDLVAPRTRALVRPRARAPIADAQYALGFFALARTTGRETYLRRGRHFLEVLERTRCAGYAHACWGYPFDWQTHAGMVPAGTPLITTQPYVYEAFAAGLALTGDERYQELMRSAATFAFRGLRTFTIADGAAACSYTPQDTRRVVNAASYRAYLLTAAGQHFDRADWIEAARRNIAFVLASQRADGSWLYAMDGRDRFVDTLHTCLVLKNLIKLWRLTGDGAVLEPIRAGVAYYRRRLLDAAGEPVPFAVAPRLGIVRRDLYDYAESINLALLLRDVEADADTLLAHLIERVLHDWVCADGHFVTRRTVLGRQTLPYHRWAQAQMFRALAEVSAAAPS